MTTGSAGSGDGRDSSTLSRCLLIDSSFRTRREVVEKVRELGLFEDVTVPDSMNNAFEIITTRHVDACLFGPSVTDSGIRSFLTSALDQVWFGDCAFVVLISAQKPSPERECIEGIHGVVIWPCSKDEFCDTIVNSLAKALATNHERQSSKNASTSSAGEFSNALFEEVGGKFNLIGEESNLPREIVDALKSLATQGVPGALSSDTAQASVKYVLEALGQWKEDLGKMSKEQAKERLHQRLSAWPVEESKPQ